MNTFTRKFSVAVLALICITASAQTKTEFLDSQFNPVNDSLLNKYTRTTVQENSEYNVQIKYKSGEVMMDGIYSDNDISVENGSFSYFYANGLMESEGTFRNGIKVGSWKRWNYDGVAKTDHFYSRL